MKFTYPTTTIRTVAKFYDSTGALFNPATVTCTIIDPKDGTSTYTYGVHPNMGNPSVGVFDCFYDATFAGRWYHKWYGEDPAGKVTHVSFIDLEPVP